MPWSSLSIKVFPFPFNFSFLIYVTVNSAKLVCVWKLKCRIEYIIKPQQNIYNLESARNGVKSKSKCKCKNLKLKKFVFS
jgi:hypothetical protein